MKKIFTKILATIFTSIIFNYISSGQSCLKAHYQLDGNASDISGNGNNGTNIDAKATTDHFGSWNKAMQFNGSTSWIKLGIDFDYPERTISIWFKADTFLINETYGHIFSTDNANFKYGACGITLYDSNGVNTIKLGIGYNVKRFTNNVKKDTWYHCAIVANSSKIFYYINNQLFDSAINNSTLHSIDGNSMAQLGCSRKTDRFFKGTIDDVRLFDCALTKTEIDSLYHFKPGQCKALFTKAIDSTQKFKLFLINKSSNSSSLQYLWDFGDGKYAGNRNPSHKYSKYGKYYICLTVVDTINFCSSKYCDSVGLDSNGKLLKAGAFELVVIDETVFGINKIIKSDFKIYPNPANTKVTIDVSKSTQHYDKLEILNASGQVCFWQTIEKGNESTGVDLERINPGLYLIKLSSDQGYSYLKMIKN